MYGHRDLPPLARLALVGWLNGVDGGTLDSPAHQQPDRDTVGALPARTPGDPLGAPGEFVPECPAPRSSTPATDLSCGSWNP
ncbi:hypothetical protein [Streptomyces sp. NPDC051219]|uniref:hypothetical protein n=1 Tax=Streptomyces sp. NPDC051219 TaxID=3155283 RepID=UPI00341ED6DC